MKESPVDKWIVKPLSEFMNNSTTSGIVLFISATLALVLSNSPLAETYADFWQVKFSIGFGDAVISKSLQYWINDGLMSMFFFVVGLELKREILAGELSNPRTAILPFVAGIGGFVLPAGIYWFINSGMDTEALQGWGIPMATDIAFALGVLYLLGDRVPLSLKIFLTALAVIDDLGAVLVIALFYTSEISLSNLGIGVAFLGLMVAGNLLGVRNSIFYGLLGIGGLWLAFLLSGIHATIAAVLAAFTIPASVKISKDEYIQKMQRLIAHFAHAPDSEKPTVTPEQQETLDKIKYATKAALTPLQKLEHALHPLVAFAVMPVFALANAGVNLSGDAATIIGSSVTIGIMIGLLFGKVLGILGAVFIGIKIRLIELPPEINFRSLAGTSFLAAIGFTMSLFITTLAFTDEMLIVQAKLGIIIASLIAGLIGYFVLRSSLNNTEKESEG